MDAATPPVSPDSSGRQPLVNISVDQVRMAQQANNFLRIALDQASEGIMILQPEFDDYLGPKILLSNTRMAVLVGAEPEMGLRGRYLTQLVETKQEAEDLIEALHYAVKNGGAHQWEGELKTFLDTRPQKCHWRIRAVTDDHANLLNYTLTIAPQVDAPASVSRSTGNGLDAEDARRLRNDNLATMSLGVLHDLNNLLGIMMTNLSVASRLTLEQEALSKHIDEAMAAAQQAREFTLQTMRMAKDLPEHREASDMAELVRATARVAQSGSGVNLHLHLPKELWWSVVDKAKVTQVVQNLIINGIQAMDNVGYMDVLARNVIVPTGHGLLPPGPHVEILVRDRGCGMTPDILAKLLKESFTTKVDGNGIGLTTCRRIIEEHQGKIHVSSMKDIGTEVTFWLPATQPRMVPTLTKNSSMNLQQGIGTILVVDDEPRLRQVIVTVLKQCGYRVFEASDGEEAIKAYQHLMRHGDEVDLVIMDLTLKGGLTGEDAMREIKIINHAAKVVASSGGLVAETLSSYLAIGFCDILPKPYLAPDIASLVHKHLGGTRFRQDHEAETVA